MEVAMANDKKQNPMQALVAVGVVIVAAIWIFGGGDTDEPEDPDAWRSQDNSTMAYIMTEDWVKERLRSPSTADFPGVFDRDGHITYNGNQTYSIRSYVDAQNAFGGTVRTHFAAEVQQTGEDTWRLLSLSLEP